MVSPGPQTETGLKKLLIGKTYKGQTILAIDYNEELDLLDLWLMGGNRVSFASSHKAILWIMSEEMVRVGINKSTQDTSDELP